MVDIKSDFFFSPQYDRYTPNCAPYLSFRTLQQYMGGRGKRKSLVNNGFFVLNIDGAPLMVRVKYVAKTPDDDSEWNDRVSLGQGHRRSQKCYRNDSNVN